MVVKILKAAAGFEGVGYSENKVHNGGAELLKAENFEALGAWGVRMGATDYARFLERHSEANEHVKRPQFHAVISGKGKETSKEELGRIAGEYLEKMGYGKNPYLIYFHKDTDNNHVHIVSSRVDGQGLKISDSLERVRSQTAMKEILMQDPNYEVAMIAQKALTYNFSTLAQLKMMLENQGVTLGEKGGEYRFIKYGQVHHTTDKAALDLRINKYAGPEERIKQLKAIISRYKPGLSHEKFAAFARENFGLEVLMHQAADKDKPYGFTLIDHAQKQVFKGSQLMKIEVFLSLPPVEDRLKAGAAIIELVSKDDTLCFGQVQADLKKLDFTLSRKGEVTLSGETKPSFQIQEAAVKRLHYNERLHQAVGFTLNNEREAAVIASLFCLKKQDAERLLALNHEQPGAIRTNAGKGEVVEKLRPRVSSGELLAHGAAPYRFDANNNMSYYIRIRTNQGEKELWGVDLERAVKEGGAEVGLRIGIENKGAKEVSAVVKDFDEQGNVVEAKTIQKHRNVVETKTIQTHRNVWDVRPLDESHYLTSQRQGQQRETAKDILNSMIANGSELKVILAKTKWIVAEKDGEHYLIDKKEKTVDPVSSLTGHTLDYRKVDVVSLDRELNREQAEHISYSSGTMGEMASTLLSLLEGAAQTGPERERKKKIGPKR